MPFRITGLSPRPFQHLFGLSDEQLANHGARRYVADSKPGYPDRIELRDAEPGESVILVNYVHQTADNAYRASHAIFLLENAATVYDRVNEVPEVLRLRTISLRAFDTADMMVNAELVDGAELANVIERLFTNSSIAYIHAHYAKRGCYAARIDRFAIQLRSSYTGSRRASQSSRDNDLDE